MVKITIKAKVVFRTKQVLKKLNTALLTGVQNAGRMYHEELRTLLLSKQGSGEVRGFRKRILFSNPGESPHWQSQNLALSVKFSSSNGSRTSNKSISRISSDVPYALTVELGGVKTTSNKPYAKYRLVPKSLPAKPMSARPAWIPTFIKLQIPMIDTIANSVRKAFK